MIEADLHNLDERELLAEVQRGCRGSFGVLAERYRHRLLRYLAARKLPPAEAEDLAQETLARAFARIGTYDRTRPFSAWLFGIAARVAASHWRARRPRVAAGELDPSAPAGSDPALRVARADERSRLWTQARRVLSPNQYTALRLRYAEEKSIKQVARSMRMTAIHVRVLLHRARKRLLTSAEFAGFRPEGRSRTRAPKRGAT